MSEEKKNTSDNFKLHLNLPQPDIAQDPQAVARHSQCTWASRAWKYDHWSTGWCITMKTPSQSLLLNRRNLPIRADPSPNSWSQLRHALNFRIEIYGVAKTITIITSFITDWIANLIVQSDERSMSSNIMGYCELDDAYPSSVPVVNPSSDDIERVERSPPQFESDDAVRCHHWSWELGYPAGKISEYK